MKTKTWILLLAGLALVCGVLSLIFFLPHGNAATADIVQDGVVLRSVDLSQDQTFTISSTYGTNTICVKDGTIAVTEADCPDQYCVKRGACPSGADIVCLPHHLIIRFSAAGALDAVTGQVS